MGSLLYKVGEVAKLTGVSVRTLHHYEAIGLLTPSQRSAKGYRLYAEPELLRLHQILVARELGLPLELIRHTLDAPLEVRRLTLRDHKQALIETRDGLQRKIRSIDAALAAMDTTGDEDTTMDIQDIFDGFDPEAHQPEAERRWGQTDAFAESARRTKNYTERDWARYKAQNDAIMRDAARLMDAGETPDSPAAREIAERHRLSIDQWFYPCSRAMHTGLADLYQADSRFRANIDRHGEGLTDFLASAIRAQG